MTRIAVLGANGQVGGEVAAHLARHADVEVRGIVRSEFGAALLRVLGIPHVVADLSNRAQLRDALGDCDAVADFTFPSGQLTEIPAAIKRNTEAVVGVMQPTAKLLHMSSIMAWGMSGDASEVASKRIPRDSYAYIKRSAEGEVLKAARQAGIATYICRLGQVHGVLQGISQDIATQLQAGGVVSRGSAGLLSNTVFASAVADAVLAAARGRSQAGLYTLVSSPQWTLGTLFGYYQQKLGSDAPVHYEAYAAVPPAVGRRLSSAAWQAITPVRGVLESYVLLRIPSAYPKVKGFHRRRSAASAASSLHSNSGPALHHITGAVPGETLSGFRCSPDEVLADELEFEGRLSRAIEAARR